MYILQIMILFSNELLILYDTGYGGSLCGRNP